MKKSEKIRKHFLFNISVKHRAVYETITKNTAESDRS